MSMSSGVRERRVDLDFCVIPSPAADTLMYVPPRVSMVARAGSVALPLSTPICIRDVLTLLASLGRPIRMEPPGVWLPGFREEWRRALLLGGLRSVYAVRDRHDRLPDRAHRATGIPAADGRPGAHMRCRRRRVPRGAAAGVPHSLW
ncbi:hypothetical protein MTO96_002777 [Rhipicephalus appendiculatus]